jgi:PAS domain S-box-containing protein
MKILLYGFSNQKKEIVKAFENIGFTIISVPDLDTLVGKAMLKKILGYALINPDNNTLFTIGQLPELQNNIGVCVFDSHYEVNFNDTDVFEGIDFIIKGVPTAKKLEKLKKIFLSGSDYINCSTYKAGLLNPSIANFCLLDNFVNLVSSGFLVLNDKGNIAFMNNVFKQMSKRFGGLCKTGEHFSFLETKFSSLYNLIQPYYEEGFCKNRIVTTVESDDGYSFSVNIVPVIVSDVFVSVVIFLDYSYSKEMHESLSKTNIEGYEDLLPDIIKANNIEQLGEAIINAAVKLTGINRVFLSLNIGDGIQKNIFRGFYRWEIETLKHFSYNYNIQSSIFVDTNRIAENVYLISPVKLLDFSDLCVASENTGEFYKILFVPIRGGDDSLLGIIRFDLLEKDKPFIKGFNILKQYLALASLAVENIRLKNRAESNAKFIRSVFNNIGDVVLVLNGDWKIVSVNNSVQELLGYSREDIVGRKINSLLGTEVIKQLKSLKKAVDKQDYTDEDTIEAEVFAKNGKKVVTAISLSLFKDSEKGQRIVLLISDISFFKKLREKELELEKLNAISQLAVAANDKINTPLTIILAHLGILKYKGIDNLSNEDFRSALSIVEAQVTKIAKIMDKLKRLEKVKTKTYAQREVKMLDLDSVDSMDSSDIYDEN